jgi:hypothetical protein
MLSDCERKMFVLRPQTITAFLLLISELSSACLIYKGVAPWDEKLPFSATITDNNVVTCWIDMSYQSHFIIQSRNHRITEDGEVWEFSDWKFKCLENYSAHADIGLRTYGYHAHGQNFSWVANIREDIEDETFVYTTTLFCGKDKQKGGKEVEKKDPKKKDKGRK